MPRMIKADCPNCKLVDGLTVAFGEPYIDFRDGYDDADFRVRVHEQQCECHPDDLEDLYEIVRGWMSECYPSKISGEWWVSTWDYKRPVHELAGEINRGVK